MMFNMEIRKSGMKSPAEVMRRGDAETLRRNKFTGIKGMKGIKKQVD